MGIYTSTGTLTAGQSRTFNLSPASAVTLTLSPNVRVTITETPATVAATGLGGNASRVHEPRLPGVVTYGPYPMGGSVLVEVASNSGSNVGWVRSDSIVAESADGAQSLVDAAGNVLPSWIAHSGCLFHGFAVSQAVDDTAFFDRSGCGNHGVFGANLSVANAWANAGYVSTVDPTGGATDSVIRIPSLAYDYASDESLVIFWRGKVTAEGSAVPLFGDTDSASTPGFKLMVQSTGKVGLWLSKGDGGFVYCGNSNTTVGGGSLVSIALVLYGKSKLYQYLADGAVDYLPTAVPAGVPLTLTASTFNIGAASPSPGGTVGVSVKTRGLAIYKFSAKDEPLQADVIAAMRQWLAATDRLLTQDAM